MISYEEFEILIDLLKKSYEECRNFNNKNNSLTLNNSLLKDVE